MVVQLLPLAIVFLYPMQQPLLQDLPGAVVSGQCGRMHTPDLMDPWAEPDSQNKSIL